jgi:hypothetical protein
VILLKEIFSNACCSELVTMKELNDILIKADTIIVTVEMAMKSKKKAVTIFQDEISALATGM